MYSDPAYIRLLETIGDIQRSFSEYRRKSEEDREQLRDIIYQTQEERSEILEKVNCMAKEMETMKTLLRCALQENATSPVDLSHVPASRLPTFPPLERTTEQPTYKNNKGQIVDMQFGWDIFKSLLKKALGPGYKEQYFRLMKASCKPLAEQASLTLMNKYKIKNKPLPRFWKDVSTDMQLITLQEFEQAAQPYLPLAMCVDHWGARLFIRKFWLKGDDDSTDHK